MLDSARVMSFSDACELVGSVLDGAARRDIVSRLATARDFASALRRLRDAMTSGAWTTSSGRVQLQRMLDAYDAKTRGEGFNVLHDWDGIADEVNPQTIPVDVLDFLIEKRGSEAVDRAALSMLIDYYFLYVLALLSLRIWDNDDADGSLERLHVLLDDLQGPNGSGHRFATDAETLILIATSHYEMNESGFASLLERVRTLSQGHRTNVAIGHAVSMGCHLRFGLRATYAGDPIAMRNDNAADYPWLGFALATVMNQLDDAGTRGDERDRLVEALLNGLSADARAFVGTHVPLSLAACADERRHLRDGFHARRQQLLDEFERYRPSEQAYSPLSFFFNFSHNIVKGTVIDALMWGDPRPIALNDMLTQRDGGRKKALATTLMDYARAHPNPIGGRLMPAIVYDPVAGRRAFAETLRVLRAIAL
jgi:hypothetical protein